MTSRVGELGSIPDGLALIPQLLTLTACSARAVSLVLLILQSRDLGPYVMEAEYVAHKGKVTCPRSHGERAWSGLWATQLPGAFGPQPQPLLLYLTARVHCAQQGLGSGKAAGLTPLLPRP